MAEPNKHSMSERAATAEAFLLAEGGPVSMKKLLALVGGKESDLKQALDELAGSLESTGMALVRTTHEVSLATSPRVSDAVRKAFEELLARDIGNAGLEVLAVVLYRGPSTRSAIDYVRGVNTSSTIRVLLSRGLLERVPNPNDGREYLYRSTTDLLAHLGIRSAEELPDHATIRSELDTFERTQSAFDAHGTDTATSATD